MSASFLTGHTAAKMIARVRRSSTPAGIFPTPRNYSWTSTGISQFSSGPRSSVSNIPSFFRSDDWWYLPRLADIHPGDEIPGKPAQLAATRVTFSFSEHIGERIYLTLGSGLGVRTRDEHAFTKQRRDVQVESRYVITVCVQLLSDNRVTPFVRGKLPGCIFNDDILRQASSCTDIEGGFP
jgi:hypothetical protein